MTWISVGARTSEIGLLRAMGASRAHVLTVFLVEASMLATIGGAIGVAGGMGIAAALRLLIDGLPVHTPPIFIAFALIMSFATGILSGLLPARRAASLDPIVALRTE